MARRTEVSGPSAGIVAPMLSKIPSAPARPPARRALVPTLAVAALTAVTAVVSSGTASAATASTATKITTTTSAPPTDVTVTVDPTTLGLPVPAGSVGLSYEAAVLDTGRIDGAAPGNLAAMLRGLGPGVLRLGGNSVDRTEWTRTGVTDSWASAPITPADIDRLGTFVRATGWTVVLGVDLAHDDRLRAADEAAYAASVLGPALIGVEVGNEPNNYVHAGYRDAGWTVDDYISEYTAYRDAIDAAVPGLTVIGPSSYLSFVNPFARAGVAPGGLLSQHTYPLNACSPSEVPTVPLLLSRTKIAGTARDITAGVASATAAGMRLRLDESGSVICSGYPGVSDSFASALWTAQFVLTAAGIGAVGINMHDGSGGVCGGDAPYYAPICARTPDDAAAGRFTAMPGYYGLLVASRFEGTTQVKTSISYDAQAQSMSFASTDAAGVLRVLVLDLDTTGASSRHHVKVTVPGAYGAGTLETLAGPSVDATVGTRFAGAAVAPDGSFTPATAKPISTETPGGGTYALTVDDGSASLLTLRPACTMPRLTGLRPTAAKKALVSAGCQVGRISGYSSRTRSAIVTKQYGKPGRRYALLAHIGFKLGLPPKRATAAKPTPKTTTTR